MKSIHRHVTRFWTNEENLTAFLILLIVEIFVVGSMPLTGLAVVVFNNVVFSLLLLAGLLTITSRRSIQAVLALFVALALATRWAHLVAGIPELKLLDWSFMMACTMAFLVIVLRQVYREGPVTAHRIQGSVAAYLLLSIIFASAYSVVEHLHPGSFQISVPALSEEFDGRVNWSFYYFSVVTLTTTGYGDITPVSPVARTLVMMEALIGQLYPAILIARLVSLHVESNRHGKDS